MLSEKKEYDFVTSDRSFSSEIENILTCKICLDLITNPVQCKVCENCFCNLCINITWAKGCPMRCDNESLFSSFKKGKPNKTFTHIYDNVKIKCNECIKVMSIKKYKDHKNLCILNKFVYKFPSYQNYFSTNIPVNTDNFNNESHYKALYLNLLNEYNSLKTKYLSPSEDAFTNLSEMMKSYNIIQYVDQLQTNLVNYYQAGEVVLNQRRKDVPKGFHWKIYKYLTENCSHVASTCIPIFDCCDIAYPCVNCHNESQNCKAYAVEKIYCKRCFTDQLAWGSRICEGCHQHLAMSEIS